jgi:hypothetical protein
MEKYIKLFKALPVIQRTKELNYDYLEDGFLIEDSIFNDYSIPEIEKVIKRFILTDKQLNQTFHKSWKKVNEAPELQLRLEQIMHYFTTYGFEALGVYDKDFIYIPPEVFKSSAKNDIPFIIIKGITHSEIIERVDKLLSSGVALSENYLEDLSDIMKEIGVEKFNIDNCKNKEMRIRLYVILDKVPSDPVEFLRLVLFKHTGSSLLIKNKEVI